MPSDVGGGPVRGTLAGAGKITEAGGVSGDEKNARLCSWPEC